MKGSAALVLLACGLRAHEAAALPDFTVTPSVTLAEVHDDNIFISATQPTSDSITRLTPALMLDYKAEAVSWRANYSRDLEEFADQSQLDSSSARQSAALAADFQVNQQFSIDVDGTYLTTPTPGELNTTTGLESGRVDTTRKTAGTKLNYSFTQAANATLAYQLTSDSSASGIGADTRELVAGFAKTLSATTTLLFGDAYRQYSFDNAADQHSNTPAIGISHQFSRSTGMRAQAGPRFFAGTVKPYISLMLQHDFASSGLTFNYNRSESVVSGVNGTVESSMSDVTYTQQFGTNLKFSLTPAYGTVTGAGTSAKIYRLGFDGSYRLNELLSLGAAWQYSRQRETLGAGALLVIPHNVFVLGINLVYPLK